MNNIDANIVLLVLGSFIIFFIIFFLYMIIRQQHRNEHIEKQLFELAFHSKFSVKRTDLEESVIALGKEFQKNTDDFSDIYHLPLRGQTLSEGGSSNFLKSMGLSQNSIKVKEDFVFVLTPFSDPEKETYAIIRNGLTESGFIVSRGDEKERLDIFPHIVKSIIEARLVIANINGRNPNVMYELGIAHMLDKSVVMVAELQDDISRIPFDLRAKNIVLYDDLLDLKKKLPIAALQVLSNAESTKKI